MRTKRYAAIAALILIVGLLWSIGGKADWFNKDEQLGGLSWPAWDLSQVSSIRLSGSAADLSFVLRDGEWFVAPGLTVSPTATAGEDLYRADQTRLAALLSFISKSPPRRLLEAKDLDSPAFKDIAADPMTISISGPETWTLKLGRPVRGNLPAIAANGTVPVLLDPDYMAMLNRRMDYYQDTHLVPLSGRGIKRVQISGPEGESWEITRTRSGFSFVRPESMVAAGVDEAAMDYYLHTLSVMKVFSLLPESSEEAIRQEVPLLDQNPYQITVTGSSDREYVIKLYRNGPDDATKIGYSSWQDAFFVLPAQRFDTLVVPAVSLQQRRILDFIDLSSITRQRISPRRDDRPEQDWFLRRTAEGWEDEKTGQVLSGFDLLLWRLGNIKYEDAPLHELPENMALVMDWELGRESGTPTVLHFYAEPGQAQCLVKVAGQTVYYQIPNRLLTDVEGYLPHHPSAGTEREN